MKKNTRWVILGLASVMMLATGCQGNSHTHSFTEKNAIDTYLAEAATCTSAAKYYYSCSCGETGEKTFTQGDTLVHNFINHEAEEYLKTPANCQSGATYFMSCEYCGTKSYRTFTGTELGDHIFNKEVPNAKYMKEDATVTSGAVYYKSCVCGLGGTVETFTYGDPLREYTEEEKKAYAPISLTVALYDAANSVYGFTYNTQNEPLRPVIQVAKGSSFTDYAEYPATVEAASSYDETGGTFEYYIVKAEVALEDSTTYTYRAYDKYVGVGTDTVTFQTKDLDAETFSFAHLSDSQNSDGLGTYFGNVLSKIVGVNDFIVHTGDFVEDSKYEYEWTNMVHGNFEYLSKIPVMAISGNHETTYKNGSNETYKHFNVLKPQQEDTKLGYYYSYTYGNAKFIMLNTNRLKGNKLTSDQYDWLISELENNTAEWTFVAMHNPMYSSGRYGSESDKNGIALALQAQLKEIFAVYGVDVVLQGHDHVVSRTNAIDAWGDTQSETFETVNGVEYSVDPNGVIYVMNGPAGTQTRGPSSAMDASLYKYALASKGPSWAEFAIDGNRLVITAKYLEGGSVKEYTKWGIRKSEN